MRWLVVVALLSACGGQRTTPERLGDDAWHRGEFTMAAAHYRRAPATPHILAKRADASLRGGHLLQAAELYRSLALTDPSRAGESAAGLVRVAMSAERAGNQAALAASLTALRQVAPTWPLGRLALRLSPDSGWDAATTISLAHAGIAAGGVTDRWLLALGRAWQRTARCEEAIGAFETLRRREKGPTADTAATMAGQCSLSLGLTALARGEVGVAEWRLDQAMMGEPNGATARRALVALGDLRMGRGELLAAFLAWQQVINAPVPTDSITVLALDRLRASQTPEPFTDSSVVPGPH